MHVKNEKQFKEVVKVKKDYIFKSTHKYVIRDAVAQQLNKRLENDEQTRLDSIAAVKNDGNKQYIIKELGLSKKTTMEKLRREFEIRESPEKGICGPTFRGWFKGKTVPSSSNMLGLKDFLNVRNNFDLIFTSKKSALTYEHELFFEIMNIIIWYFHYIESDKSLNGVLSLFGNNILIKKIILDLWMVLPYMRAKFSLIPKDMDDIPKEKILESKYYIEIFLAIKSYFERIFKLDATNNYGESSLRFKQYSEITMWELLSIQNIALDDIFKYTHAFNDIVMKNIAVPSKKSMFLGLINNDKLEAIDIVNKVNQRVIKEYNW